MSRIDELLRTSAQQWQEQVDALAAREQDRRASAAHLRRSRRRVLLRRWPLQLAGMAAAAAAVVMTVWLVHHAYDPQPPSPGSGSGASCAAPQLQVGHAGRPAPLVRGEQVTVTGRYFVEGCNDYPGAEQQDPIASVRLTLTPRGGHPIRLTTVHPTGELGTFTATVTIPADTPTGRARLDGAPAQGLPVVVR